MKASEFKFNKIEEAIKDIANGKMVVVLDDEDRENEGDLIMAAAKVTPDDINFMATQARGLICTPITKKRAAKLQLDLMVKDNDALHHTAFTVSIDSDKAGTGISTSDRAMTITALIDEKTTPQSLLRPGHIFPLIAKDNGVLERPGHTEAAVDLCKLASLPPAGVICEIINADGTMSRTPELIDFAQEFDLKIITIKDLIDYRNKETSLVEEISRIDFSNKFGDFKLAIFEDKTTKEHHTAIFKGDLNLEDSQLVRLHSECFTGDIFGSHRCDCGEQLELAMKIIEKAGRGILLYMKQEGRGIGLPNKIKAYELQDNGLDTVQANQQLGFSADLREYNIGAEILKHLGAKKIHLMTNNPDKIAGLKAFGIEITKRIPLEVSPNNKNINYLKTKKEKMGHLLHSSLH